MAQRTDMVPVKGSEKDMLFFLPQQFLHHWMFSVSLSLVLLLLYFLFAPSFLTSRWAFDSYKLHPDWHN